MDSNYGLATVLFNTATMARRTSECSQTFGAKGLNQYESLLSADIRMDTFLWFGKPLTRSMCGEEKFLGYKFLKTRIMETESPNWRK